MVIGVLKTEQLEVYWSALLATRTHHDPHTCTYLVQIPGPGTMELQAFTMDDEAYRNHETGEETVS